ncbi:MAG: hypothetical protein WB777_14305 [Mycobacterium sp.]
MTVQRMEYVGNAAPTTLASDLSISGLSFNIADATGYPTGVVGKFTLVLNAPTPTTPGGATEETILCTGIVGTLVTVDPAGRGFDGTLPQTHSSGESVQVCWTAFAANQDNLHNASTDNVHGAVGNVVGDSDVQELTNKTLDGTENTFTNIPASAIIGGGQLLARNQTAAWPTRSTTYVGQPSDAIIDGTHATLTFTVPASGDVWLVSQGSITIGSDGNYPMMYWKNHAGGGVVSDQRRIAANDSSVAFRDFTATHLVTGLSAGTTVTLDLWGGINAGSQGYGINDVSVAAWSA